MPDPGRVEHVVTDVKYGREDAEALVRAFAPAQVVWLDDRSDNRESLRRAEVGVLRKLPATGLAAMPRLRWIHWDHAGLDEVATPEMLASGVILTSSAGRSAPALAQHAFYFALALTHNAHEAMQAQQSRVWRGGSPTTGSLWGKTLGLIGLGHIGREILPIARSFGMRTLVYTRSEPTESGIDDLYCQARGDLIDLVLAKADVVMIAVPLTDQTRHLIGRVELAQMKTSSFVVNVSRGAVVDETALVDALCRGDIAGAGLDVFEREPLPPDAPIWRAPNVLITCHETPRMPDRDHRSVRIIAENVRRLDSGQPMLNACNPADVLSAADTESVQT